MKVSRGMKRNYNSRKNGRLIDPTKIGGPSRPLFLWEEGQMDLDNKGLTVRAKILANDPPTQIGGVFGVGGGAVLPTAGFTYEDSLGGFSDPMSVEVQDGDTIKLEFADELGSGALWIFAEQCKVNGVGGQRPSPGLLSYSAS